MAEQYEIHPQTLRLYEREGLLKPSRSDGNTRLYTAEDLERLEVILHLTRDLGVNLAGVEIILNMREKMGDMQSQIQEFVATLNRELAAHNGAARQSDRRNSLIPVINARLHAPACHLGQCRHVLFPIFITRQRWATEVASLSAPDSRRTCCNPRFEHRATIAYVAPFLAFVGIMALETVIPLPPQWLYPVRFLSWSAR